MDIIIVHIPDEKWLFSGKYRE